jgi:hypothetical protein
LAEIAGPIAFGFKISLTLDDFTQGPLGLGWTQRFGLLFKNYQAIAAKYCDIFLLQSTPTTSCFRIHTSNK